MRVVESVLLWTVVGVLFTVTVMFGVSVGKPKSDSPQFQLPATDTASGAAVRLPPVSSQPLSLSAGQTVVSITFDDGRASNALAGRILAAHGLAGTFFINSGTVGQPGFMSLTELVALAQSGSEIGGHTATHPDLEDIRDDEAGRQICNDRTTLLDWGFPVRSFAYPFASTTREVQNIVANCGYNSARSLGELYPVRLLANVPLSQSCVACDLTETLPPANPMYTRAPAQFATEVTTADMERRIDDATAVGGWLQITFHGLCPDDCTHLGDPVDQFEQFITWLAARQADGAILVRTVGEVIGGPVRPAVTAPLPAPAPPGVNGLVNPRLEERTDRPYCWMQSHFGHNSAQFDLVEGLGGGTASRLVMRDHVDGDAKLIQLTDLGTCAPAVVPGHRYTIRAWYKSTVPTSFAVQFRLPRGTWVYGTASPTFEPADDFTLAQWTLPIPESVSAVSFGLSLAEDGVLVTDDYSIVEDAAASP